jgi:hypothetical protein
VEATAKAFYWSPRTPVMDSWSDIVRVDNRTQPSTTRDIEIFPAFDGHSLGDIFSCTTLLLL